MGKMLRTVGLLLLTLLCAASLFVGAKEGAFNFQPVNAVSPTLKEEEAETAEPSVEVSLEDRMVTLQPAVQRLKTLRPEERNFVKAYVEALRKHDAAALKALVHPASLQCLGERDARFLPSRLQEEAARNVAKHYYLYLQEEDQSYTGEAKALMERYYADPVPPTYTLAIFHPGAGPDESSIVQKLAVLPHGKQPGELRLVLGCPTEETIRNFKNQQAEKQQLEAEVQAAYSNLNETLKSALADRIKNRQLQQAVQDCIAQCGVEPSVAYGVVLRIKQERGL